MDRCQMLVQSGDNSRAAWDRARPKPPNVPSCRGGCSFPPESGKGIRETLKQIAEVQLIDTH